MEREDIAERLIQDHVLYATAGGVIPIPLLDLAAVTAVQIDLVRALARTYDVPFDAATGKGVVVSVTGASAARLGASVLKAFPGVGTLAGAAAEAALAGASTYAVGHLFRRHFKGQGTLATLDPEAVRPTYRKLLEHGKEAVQSIVGAGSQGGVAERARQRTVAETARLLKEIGLLRAEQVITEEEFARLKAEVLGMA